MKYIFEGVIIVMDEISSIGQIYISTSIYSPIEQNEITNKFYSVYNSLNKKSQHIDKFHLCNIGEQTFRIQVLSNSADQLQIKPIIISNQKKNAIIYLPGGILFEKYKDHLISATQTYKIQRLYLDPSYVLKKTPQFTQQRQLGIYLLKKLPKSQVQVFMPQGFDLHYFLNWVSKSYQTPNCKLPTYTGYIFANKFIYEPFPIKNTLLNTIHFMSQLAHTSINSSLFRLFLLPLLDAEHNQIEELPNTIIIRIPCFQLLPEIQLIAGLFNTKFISISSHYSQDKDEIHKQRRLDRISRENKVDVKQNSILTISEQEYLLLKLARMI
ncbi:hypothetical protein SS50377_20181 [Spironucleus salmonicida]|uniref:Uncharacterized protein n=1 Tax=Spironucleus salmonicida TaxID=348837 RepID=V6LNE4_9EUKA|nr:hypothetical protein SS50377_20181 [Spironucleus salmonicida]|eukprot:EST45236.1 Hypothetical protein SS50377_14812 [Spironucleus salmonicida]